MFRAIYRIMTTNKLPLYFIVTILAAMFSAGCNSDTDGIDIAGDFGNCTVTSFSLQKDDSVLAYLDSVFFSIDVVNAEIFNADSLPKGTDVSKLLVNVSTSSARSCELTYRIPGTLRDTTVNYVDEPNDSINFADGPVKMVVTSYDGQTKMTYNVRVNVHEVNPDTLYWAESAMRELPGRIAAPTAQKTVEHAGEVVCMTTDGSSASVSKCSNPYDWNWTSHMVSLPAGADVNSFTSTSDSYYILDSDGNLYSSADAETWNPTGAKLSYIYGGYKDMLLAARHDSDGWKHVTYPATVELPLVSGCPVSGTGEMIVYETKWSVEPLAMFVGGRDAAGTLSGATWGYDGKSWIKLSNTDIDERENVSVFPYFAPKVSATWRVTENTVLIALGGSYETSDGVVASKNVYVSFDQGLNWKEADSYMQLPEYMPGFSNAQAIVADATLHVSRSMGDGWQALAAKSLPAWAFAVPSHGASRLITPVTEWECPYVYLFGGQDAEGDLFNTVWRGVINRFTFKPIC